MEQTASLNIWLTAVRPKTLIASICPVIIGTLLALDMGFNPLMFISTLFAALFIQIGTNIANDYYDFIQGADTKERKGPKRISQSGLIPLKMVKKGFIAAFAIATLFGLYPMMQGGLAIIGLGILSIVCGIFYTKGKYSIGYTGLADLFVLFFFGILATGFTYFLQTGQYSDLAFIAGIGPGCISAAILCANNLRDEKEDRNANKKTLVVRFGKSFGKIEYTLCLCTAYVTLTLFSPYISFIFLFFSILLIRKVYTTDEPKELISLLEKTAKLLVLYTLIFSLGRFL